MFFRISLFFSSSQISRDQPQSYRASRTTWASRVWASISRLCSSFGGAGFWKVPAWFCRLCLHSLLPLCLLCDRVHLSLVIAAPPVTLRLVSLPISVGSSQSSACLVLLPPCVFLFSFTRVDLSFLQFVFFFCLFLNLLKPLVATMTTALQLKKNPKQTSKLITKSPQRSTFSIVQHVSRCTQTTTINWFTPDGVQIS